MSVATKKHFPLSFKQIAVAALGAWILVLFLQIEEGKFFDDERTETVYLVVSFEPGERAKKVLIHVTIDGSEVINTGIKKAPYQQGIRIPKGARVHAHVRQEEPGKLVCVLFRTGEKAFLDRRETFRPEGINCRHNY